MAMTIENLAQELSLVLKEEIRIDRETIVLGGVEPGDYAVLQVGANDGYLYLSIPIIEIDEASEGVYQQLSILMELNGDTKNYPRARIAYNSIEGSASWIELIEENLNVSALVELIQARGKLIAQIRYAMDAVAKA